MPTPYLETLRKVARALRQERDEASCVAVTDIIALVQRADYLSAAQHFLLLSREVRARIGVPPMNRLEDLGDDPTMDDDTLP